MMNVVRHDLVATFAKSNGDPHRWTYKDLDLNLPVAKIKEACELLTVLDIFEQDGIKLFNQVVTAKVVTYKEELLFDPEHEPMDVPSKTEQPAETALEIPEKTKPTRKERVSNEPTGKSGRIEEIASPAISSTAHLSSADKILRDRYVSPTTFKPEPAIKVESTDFPPEDPATDYAKGEEGASASVKPPKKWRRFFQWRSRKQAQNKADPEEFS